MAREIGNELNVPSFGYEIDVTSEDSVAAAQAAVEAEVRAGNLPAVGALANIAGITSPVPFLETSLELWNKVMAVNATGTYLVTKAFLPGMLEHKWGRIVNMSSVSAQRGGGIFGGPHYSAAKAGVLGLGKAMARELGPDGIRVNSITPGLIQTDITGDKLTDDLKAEVIKGIPLGRLGVAVDIANACLFLASDLSSYITGATIDVNGGMLIH
mgnify:CR=1 FL=1